VRAVFQRVKRAGVSVSEQEVASIGRGAMVLLAVGKDDTEKDAHYMAEKIAGLRVFPDSNDKMNLSLVNTGGEVLLISQFTLYGDVKKGKRPGFDGAAPPEMGERLYLLTAEILNGMGVPTRTGVFGAHMEVELVNDGPVTILISSKKEF
jgi:D-tyrosyl-tRNA(Tyr) deacylase